MFRAPGGGGNGNGGNGGGGGPNPPPGTGDSPVELPKPPSSSASASTSRLPAASSASDSAHDPDWEYYDDAVTLSDFWQEIVDIQGVPGSTLGPDLDEVDPVPLWVRLGEKPDPCLTSEFWEYWRVAVPALLSPAQGATSIGLRFHEKRVEKALLEPLDNYIAGGKERAEEVFQVSYNVTVFVGLAL